MGVREVILSQDGLLPVCV